jgi:hypothetical protein
MGVVSSTNWGEEKGVWVVGRKARRKKATRKIKTLVEE